MSDIARLLEDLARLSRDPYRFVLWAFPWGEAGTELDGCSGPEAWQQEVLEDIGRGLMTPSEAIQIAIASGHGVGKSALVAWIMLWAISTFPDARGVVTANTEVQLKTKTWAELGKWYRLFVARELFQMTATSLYSSQPMHERTWRIDMVPWSEKSVEAFAGLHNQGKRILVVFDEASAIPDVIWETTEGALTDEATEIVWAVCGNPTRNTGRFRECFGRYSSRWVRKQVDSESVSLTNKPQFRKWIEDYGEDSDFVRVRIRGTFPRAGSMQFISSETIDQAMTREVGVHVHDPFVIGVDVARFGDDQSVIYFRKGRDGRTHRWLTFRGADTMTLAGRVAEEYQKFHADAIFVDGGGVGGGVIDRLRQLQVPVIEVQFGSKPDRRPEDGTQYKNKRAEIWGLMRDWLKGGAIPHDVEFQAELGAVEYGFDANNAIQLEKKEDMKKRGLQSPDIADALALTFAYPVMMNEAAGGPHARPNVEADYDPFEPERLIA